MVNKDVFKTGIKNAETANLKAVTKKINGEKTEKIPVNLIEALGLSKGK